MNHLKLDSVKESRSDRLQLELRNSRETLGSLDLSHAGDIHEGEWLALIVGCPNLEILKMSLHTSLHWPLNDSGEIRTSRLKVAELGQIELQAGEWERLVL